MDMQKFLMELQKEIKVKQAERNEYYKDYPWVSASGVRDDIITLVRRGYILERECCHDMSAETRRGVWKIFKKYFPVSRESCHQDYGFGPTRATRILIEFTPQEIEVILQKMD